jgi:hypothetical protein
LMQDPKKYLSLAKRAYSEYQTRLNWSVSITKLSYLLETQIISSTS